MNIKDFLIDNYIWIIIIILITIITIIGFLADKKKNGKKKEESLVNNNSLGATPMNNLQTVTFSQPNENQNNQLNNNVNNNMQGNYNIPTAMPQNGITPSIQPMGTEPIPVPNQNIPTTSPLPVENIVPQVEVEPMPQPLSEQRPVEIQPVQNSMEMPMTMQQQPMPQNNVQNMQNSFSTPIMSQNQAMNNNQYAQINTGGTINTTQTNHEEPNAVQPVNNNLQMGINSSQNIPVSNTVNPTQIPIPQPVNPQPIIQNQYNNSQMMSQPNYSQPMPQQPTNMNQPQPINFVYGPQNNNQNM